jgi:apolipoprotein N-acyltransferase
MKMKRSYRLLLSILSGLLLSLAWLGFPGWTLFIAFLPLLFLDQFFLKEQANYRSVSFFGHAFISVLIWNVATTFWVANATLIGALMAFMVNSFVMALVLWLSHIARRNFRNNLGYFALIVFWISLEYIHYHWDIEWPWLHLGNGFANNIKIIQWYEYTGVFGGTLWVLIMNILLFKVVNQLLKKQAFKEVLYPAIASILLLIVPLSISFSMYYSYVEKENPKNIVVLQPNVDPYTEGYGRKVDNRMLQKLLKLSEEKVNDKTDFIVAPETSFEERRYWNENALDKNHQYKSLARFIKKYDNAEIVFGVASSKIYPDKKSASETARTQGDVIYDVFNAACFIDRNGQNQMYHKSKLVVGVEKMPFMKYLDFLGDIVIDIGGSAGSYGRQKEPSNFISKDGTKVAPVICYESIFGEFVTDYVKKGAELIFIITNDGWWKNTPGYKQHMSFARLRAIETRRSIARSANTGISCFINQRGDVFQPTGWWVDAVIEGTINTNDELTFYVKYGDYIARISLFVSVLLILNLVVKRFT